MRRIPFDELRERTERVLLGVGLSAPRAALAARLIAETDRDGIRTHGVARLPRLVEMIRLGQIDPAAEPAPVTGFGALERWTGHRGPGNLAAYTAMQRAMALAETHGLGAVALGDTTHWMRGGTFGWQAAEAGFAALCWTNTLPNMPPWGATTPALGNNPLVIAVPRGGAGHPGAPIVLDIAMSQFSYGALAAYREAGTELPVPGGFDAEGTLTRDAGAIESSGRSLPIGFWKGSGLAFVLDVLGTMLAGGSATHQIEPDALKEVGQSQVFIAIKPTSLAAWDELNAVVEGCIDALHAATPVAPEKPVRYPGEGALRIRKESLKLGVPVEESLWQAVVRLGS